MLNDKEQKVRDKAKWSDKIASLNGPRRRK